MDDSKMSICKNCGKRGLEWTVGEKSKWVFYDPETGNFHQGCKYNPGSKIARAELVKKMSRDSSCPHGILLDRSCPYCEEERHKDFL